MSVEAAESGVRARTRQAILEAAVSVWSRRPTASLAEIAEAAQVGRTTVHRYFPERASLEDALSLHMLEQLRAALRRARLGDGAGREAVLRAGRELFDLGDILAAMAAGEPEFWQRPEWQVEDETDAWLRDAVTRGHADGSIDASLAASFITEGLLWSLLYSAVTWLNADEHRSRHDALAMVIRSLDGALRPGPAPDGPSA